MNILKNFAAKTFAKKIIGLGMAMVMAFGGFAANAVKFDNYTGEYVDVYYSGSLDCFKVHCVFWSTKNKSWESIDTELCLGKILGIEDIIKTINDNELDKYLNKYVDNNPILKRFLDKRIYRGTFNIKEDKLVVNWRIEKEYSLKPFFMETIIFDYFMRHICGAEIEDGNNTTRDI